MTHSSILQFLFFIYSQNDSYTIPFLMMVSKHKHIFYMHRYKQIERIDSNIIKSILTVFFLSLNSLCSKQFELNTIEWIENSKCSNIQQSRISNYLRQHIECNQSEHILCEFRFIHKWFYAITSANFRKTVAATTKNSKMKIFTINNNREWTGE